MRPLNYQVALIFAALLTSNAFADANILQTLNMQVEPKDRAHEGYRLYRLFCDRQHRTCSIEIIFLGCGGPYENHPSIDVWRTVRSGGTGYNQLWVEDWTASTLKTRQRDGVGMEKCTFQLAPRDEFHQQVIDAVCVSDGWTLRMASEDLDVGKTCKGLIIPGRPKK